MRKLLQINPVARISTSTGRIMREIGDLAITKGWESYIAYSGGRDGIQKSKSVMIPIGNKISVFLHGIVTRIFDRHGLASWRATRLFIKDIERIKPDIIHIHNIHGYFLNYKILFSYLSKSNIPVVWTIHDCWLYTGHCYHYSFAHCNKWQSECYNCPQKKKFPTSMIFDRAKHNFRDKLEYFNSLPSGKMMLVPVSYWIEGEVKKSFLKNIPTFVIHNGIDTNIFSVKKESVLIEKYNLNNKHVLLGIASVWSEEKGLEDFIKLSGIIAENEIIVLVGIPDKIKSSLPLNIVAISRTENIEQLAELYSIATVMINPTWQDNYPTVNLEAIACGTPVITYNTGGSVESITDDTGFVVEQGDVNGILKCVRTIEELGNDYYRDKCRNYALANFRKEDRYADYIDLYEKIIIK